MLINIINISISTTDTTNLVKRKTDYNTKINEIENKTNDHDHAKYITTQEFHKLTAGNFTARLAQTNLASKDDIANFVKKTDFDDKLKTLNKNVTSNKTNHVLVENELNELSEKLNYYQQKIIVFYLAECILQAMMDFKICLFINQHLTH